MLSGFPVFYLLGWVKYGGRVEKIENNFKSQLSSICGPLRTTF
jgi:hypothetical protein